MKFGLLTFPGLYNSFYSCADTRFTQRLEPSVLYVAPKIGEKVFIDDNQPRDDVDLYLCSIYTRGWNEFRRFAKRVGRDRVIAGGYHATAMPEEAFKYARTVVVGYCGNIDEILEQPPGIYNGAFSFTPLRRDLLDMSRMAQVYPDIGPADISGSMVSSVGCPYSCDFCSTPQMSGKRMKVSSLEYVREEIENLRLHGATTVFIRDESFATNPMLEEISGLFKGKFRVVYSFGTGAVMAKREDQIAHLVKQGWHSLNFGLEDVGVSYRKNRDLKVATENCKKHGLRYVMSFIVNDDGKSREEARANYKTLYEAFADYQPSQVCANFLMPFPGTALWESYKARITEDDFDRFDSKTPIFSGQTRSRWHRRMIVAVQLKYYYSESYNRDVRNFDCGDNLYLRMKELEREFELEHVAWDRLLELDEA